MGLGNPGQAYADNRHNLGLMCLSHFAKSQNIKLDQKKGKARIGYGEIAGKKIAVARPQTFINSSGEAVKPLVRKLNIRLDNLLVIHDDLDLSLGSIRIRPGGSSAGHKGINSIVAELGSRDFNRIRAGIGRPSVSSEDDIIDYVLSDFNPEEKATVNQVISRVNEAIVCFITEGITAAMNQHNQKTADGKVDGHE